ncbi:hypothetical protein GOBAR_AA10534 [Gossypium barbadense]|uniref:Uncharacterized protein n=1 Tax=Gossypium barbadense TaxID=3634 RepID=A0A2P5Y3C7_GOSBA|nr:hypothetical protein GOBAR_AA10534 [Gossypium barbadense]
MGNVATWDRVSGRVKAPSHHDRRVASLENLNMFPAAQKETRPDAEDLAIVLSAFLVGRSRRRFRQRRLHNTDITDARPTSNLQGQSQLRTYGRFGGSHAKAAGRLLLVGITAAPPPIVSTTTGTRLTGVASVVAL